MSVKLIHKRGMHNCGYAGWMSQECTAQWKRVNCGECIKKGLNAIPKALLEKYEALRKQGK